MLESLSKTTKTQILA